MMCWIKLYRKFTEWEWYSDVNCKVVFLHLLLTANWKPKKWQGELIGVGERVIGLNSLADEVGLSLQQVRTALNKLIESDVIKKHSTNKHTVIKICNYEKYQQTNNIAEPQESQGVEDFEESEDNKRATNEQQTDNKQITTTEELKNDRIIEYKNNSGSGNIYNINNIYSKTTTAASMYQQNVGVLTPLIADILRERVEAQGEEIVQLAIAEAVECGVRNIRYIEKILISWQDSGLNTVDSIKLHQSERRSQNGKNDDISNNVKKSKFRNYPESYEVTEEEKAQIDKMMKEYEECG